MSVLKLNQNGRDVVLDFLAKQGQHQHQMQQLQQLQEQQQQQPQLNGHSQKVFMCNKNKMTYINK